MGYATKLASCLSALLVFAVSAMAQKTEPNPLLKMAVRLLTVEANIKSATAALVRETVRRHGELPCPPTLDRIHSRLERATGRVFTLYYLNDREVNAFMTANGDMIVNRGLYEYCGGDEDAIAMAVGHEIGHQVRRHVIENAIHSIILDTTLEAALGKDPNNANIEALLFHTLNSQFSRDQETEADRLGFVYAVRAGYRPEGGLTTMDVLGEVGHRRTEFFDNHPGANDRRHHIESYIQAYRKGVPLDFIAYGKLDKDLEKSVGADPSIVLLDRPLLTVSINAPPTAYTKSIYPRFKVEPHTKGYLSVLVRQPDGKVNVLFPNAYAASAACDDGKAISIPSYEYRDGKHDLVRLRWTGVGEYSYVFMITEKMPDWSFAVDPQASPGEFLEKILGIAEVQGVNILGYGQDSLFVH